MKSIKAGTSDNSLSEDYIRDKKKEPQSLVEAYRRLSRRECEVLEKIAEGKANREIADELFISISTVESHITRIGKALSMQGRGRVREWVTRQNNRQ